MTENFTIVTSVAAEASPHQAWDAWNRIDRWWGPAGFRNTVREFSFTEGGRFDVVMHGPDGTDYPNLYVFDELSPPDRVVWTNTGSAQFGLAPFRSVLEITTGSYGLTALFADAEERRKHVEDFGAEAGSRDLLQRLDTEALRAVRG